MILYVDPLSGGHHSEFIVFFCKVFDALGVEYKILVPTRSWVMARAADETLDDEHFLPIDYAQVGDGRSIGRLLDDVTRLSTSVKVDLVFFSILDPFIRLLLVKALTGKFTLPWTGIFIRDGFNAVGESLPVDIRIRAFFKLMVLRMAGQFGRGVMTFNPFWRVWMPCKVMYLPESQSSVSLGNLEDDRKGAAWPRPTPQDTEGRTVFLSFGGISERKGITDFLAALEALEDHELAKIRFRILGPSIDVVYRERVEQQSGRLRKRGARVDIDERYISPQELIGEVISSHVVVAPYRDHAGSSGVTGLAMQTGRPVIGSAQHQVGMEIMSYDLGDAVHGTGKTWIQGLTAAIRNRLQKPYVPTAKTEQWHAVRNYQNAHDTAVKLFRSLLPTK